MAVTIVLTNQKGGVGKTTSSAALSSGLWRDGYRVLAVDLDSQGNLGFSLGLDMEEGHTIYEVLKGEIPIRDAIRHTEDGADILTSDILLSEAELFLAGGGRQLTLKKVLDDVSSEYDYIIIDTPPALNILTVNGYAAADYLVIPMAAEILSLVGLIQLKETIESVQSSVNPKLNVLGILMTKYNRRTRLSREVLEMAQTVASQIGTEVFDAKIRCGVAAAEAPAHGLSIFEYAPRANPTVDYRDFVREAVQKMHKSE